MQGHSNEDKTRETMWLFQKQSSMFFSDQLGHTLPTHANANAKNLSANLVRLAQSFPPGKSEFFPEPMSKLVIVEK
jgi:hypothetical protein